MPPLPSLCDLDPLNISGDCGSSKQPPPVVNDIPVQPVCNMESVLSPRAGYVANIFQYGIPTANGTLFYYRQLDKAPYGDLIPLSEMAIFECDTTPPVCDGKTPWPKATQLSGGPDSGSGKASVDLPSGADTNGCVFTKEDKTLSSSEAQANYIDWDKGTNIPAGKIALVGYKSNGGASFYLTPATPPATPPDGSATAAQVRDAGKSGAKWSKENVGAGSSYDCLNYTGSTGNVWAVTNDSHTATGALSIWACDSKPKACGGADGPGGGNPPTGGQCTFSIPEGQACGVSCDCVSGLLCVNSVCHTKAYSDSCSSASMSCGPSNNNMPCCDPDKYQCKQNQYGNFCEPK
jgi:hypothetical protein